MKEIKRFMSLILALILMLAMSITTMAAEGDGTGKISIENAIPKQTYTIYRIFDLESYNPNGKEFSYKVNSAWEGFISSDKAKAYVSVSDTGYVTWVENAEPADFAKLALEYAKENNVPNNGTVTAGEAAEGKDTTSVFFEGLDLGYYLVDSSAGALCSLDTTRNEVKIREKNGQPKVEKEVEEDSDNSWGDYNDAMIDQTVNFRTTITAEVGAENYVLHDKMDEALNFSGIDSIGILLNNQPVDNTDASAYVIRSGNDCADGCVFEIEFTKSFCDALKANDKIVITYSAKLNEKAVVGKGVPNETWLKYGDNNETTHDYTHTYTYSFDLVKYTTDKDGKKPVLSGAEFELYLSETDEEPISFVKESDGVYRVAASTDSNTVTTIEAGKVAIKGLDGDTSYYLEETKAPAGYNKVDGRQKITLAKETVDTTNNTGSVTISNGTDGSSSAEATIIKENEKDQWSTGGVAVENQSGTLLPETGGIGTTIFYVVGGILAVGAGILLVAKRRMSNQ